MNEKGSKFACFFASCNQCLDGMDTFVDFELHFAVHISSLLKSFGLIPVETLKGVDRLESLPHSDVVLCAIEFPSNLTFIFCLTEIEKIPSFRYKPSNAQETNPTCVVCMSEYSTREKLRKLPCSHDFHSKCIDKWLKVRSLSFIS